MAAVRQISFAAGELAPALHARVDQTRYATGLKTCRNMFVKSSGGVTNRAGFRYVGPSFGSGTSGRSRMIPFIFNESQSYALVFTSNLIRFVRNGEFILSSTTSTITSITAANPAVITTSAAHGLSIGDHFKITAALDTNSASVREIAGRIFYVTATPSATTLRFGELGINANFDGSAIPATASGSLAKLYGISSPYGLADLSDIQYAQSADVMKLVHPSYAPRDLVRLADNSWTLTASAFDSYAAPTASAASGGAGGNYYRYAVTAVSPDTGEESSPSVGLSFAITGASIGSPCVITAVGHTFVVGDEVVVTGIAGVSGINNKRFRVSAVGVNLVTLQNSTSTGTYSSGGVIYSEYERVNASAAPTTLAPHVVTIDTAIAGYTRYNIYRSDGNDIFPFGWIGSVSSSAGGATITFSDTGYTPDFTNQPPVGIFPFAQTGDYPAAVGFYQQRLLLGGANNFPETIDASGVGAIDDFRTKFESLESGALSFSLTGKEVSRVRHIVDAIKLLIFTNSGEWIVNGDSGSGALTPTQINARQHSYNGSGSVPPIVIDGAPIYVQERGSIVRDIGFDQQVDGYRGSDLGIFSRHLLEGYTVVDWAFQKSPHSTVWMVRSDGAIINLTYIREHQIVGWSRHDGDWSLESMCAIPEGNETAIYAIGSRFINSGATQIWTVERLSDRTQDDQSECIYSDGTASYDGRVTSALDVIDLTGGTTWEAGETITLLAGGSHFRSIDVGSQIHISSDVYGTIRLDIVGFFNASTISVQINESIPAAWQGTTLTPGGSGNTGINFWAIAVKTAYGFGHLHAKNVAILGDGYVVASPNNPAYPVVTVDSAGKITIPGGGIYTHYAVIRAGLPYVSDLQTLDIDTTNSETLSDKKMLINQVSIFVEKSRGGFVGQEPDSDTSLTGLVELRSRESGESYDQTPTLNTKIIKQNIESKWGDGGRIFIRQVDPLPLTVLSVTPTGMIPFRG